MREQSQAYLDGSLDAEARARFEDQIRSDAAAAGVFASVQAFHVFCRRACEKVVPVEAPEGLRARLLAGLDAPAAVPAAAVHYDEPAHESHDSHDHHAAPARPPRAVSIWGPLMMAATVMLVVTLAAFAQSMLLKFHCPYMLACAAEHTKILHGNAPVAVQSSDPAQLTRYVEEVVDYKVAPIKGLRNDGMTPVAAGRASFAALERYMAHAEKRPSAAFVRYQCKQGSPCVIMLYHHWADGMPDPATYDKATGFFTFDHHGQSVVCWRADSEILCSMVSKRPMNELVALATEARNAQASPEKAKKAGAAEPQQH